MKMKLVLTFIVDSLYFINSSYIKVIVKLIQVYLNQV